VSKSLLYVGRILIYSTPAALAQHIEWAISRKLGQVINLKWVNQPLNPATLAMEFEYQHQSPVADQIATVLKGWHYIRFEITQVNKNTRDAVLYRATPDLGLHQANLSSLGDVVLNENQVNTILKNSFTNDRLISNLENALGNAWELELEPYRLALALGMKNIVSKSG
jgi:hypothetical protein